MSSRMRSADSSAVAFDTRRESPGSSTDGSQDRRASSSYRASRRGSGAGTGSRLNSRATGGSSSANRQRSSRVRRPTPVAGRRSRATGGNQSASDSEPNDPSPVEVRGSARRGRRRIDVNVSSSNSNQAAKQLTWYERLMPECLLSMSAPITGYETRLDSDVDEDEFEILERQRLKRNRRVRRRLLTLILVATLASVVVYTRGRTLRKVGVKAAVNTMKNRIEDGLSKSFHDTIGK